MNYIQVLKGTLLIPVEKAHDNMRILKLIEAF